MGAVLTANFLHRFPILKGSFDRLKIARIAITRMLLDGGPYPCKSAAPRRACGIFHENFCKRVGEFAIARVKPFGEPAIHRSQQFARFAYLALVAPETREAYGSAEFPGLRLLLACDCECAFEVLFRLCCFDFWGLQRDFGAATGRASVDRARRSRPRSS
jgi:hypothetical protein